MVRSSLAHPSGVVDCVSPGVHPHVTVGMKRDPGVQGAGQTRSLILDRLGLELGSAAGSAEEIRAGVGADAFTWNIMYSMSIELHNVLMYRDKLRTC